LALRSAVKAKEDYWQSIIHLQRFTTFAYDTHRQRQGLPLRFVQVAQELARVARTAFINRGFTADPIRGNHFYWWSNLEHPERHLARLERAIKH